MNTFKMVKVFLTSIDCGSFTKAAEFLGYTQSNLTQMMKAFEDELGIPLLIKTKRGVEPTSEATLLIPAMRAMAAQEERFLQEADEIRGLHRGSIRIGSYVSTSSTWLPQVIGHYQSTFPEVEFNIVESGQEEMLRGLLAGDLDLALMSAPENSEVDFIPVLEDPMVVVFRPDHALGAYDYVPLEKLQDYPLIMTYREYDTDANNILLSAGLDTSVKYRSKDDFAVLSMVQHGLGISILPELTLERFPGSYDYRMLDPEFYRSLGIGIRSIKEAGPLARSVISYIKDNIR
ncbi:MAG: LysR family transcriptional regulator [Oscillospiraceae bacterium]|nr:LysR family transcriptional regulator [Oscillospiraceae bacterium]